MFLYYNTKNTTTYCVLLSNSDTHLVISFQSTKQIRNRYSLQYHPKPSFFLLYIPFNQSINLTKTSSNPYPTRFLALNLTTIVSSPNSFNQPKKFTQTTITKYYSHLKLLIEKEHPQNAHHIPPHHSHNESPHQADKSHFPHPT